MKISRFAVKNFQGLHAFDLPVRAPLLMFTGPNGAGKSSVRDAIAMGLSGAPTRVSKKKDYDQLVHESHQTASIEIDLADGRRSVTALPGDGTKFAGNASIDDQDKARAALPYLLAPQTFAAATADDRRGVLFTLTGCKASTGEVSKRLTARGADSAKIEAVLPLLRVGFPEAEKDAKGRAMEAKGAWRAVTGETYGEKRAETWKAEKPAVAEQDLLQAEHDLDVVDGEITQANQAVGELQARWNAQQGRAQKIAQLEEAAGKLERIRTKLAADESDLAAAQAKVDRLSDSKLSQDALPCPCCNAMLVVRDGQLVEAGPLAHGTEDDLAALPELTKARDMMQRAVDNDRQALKAAEDAEAQLTALEEETGEPVTEVQLEQARQRVTVLNESRKQLAQKLDEHRAAQRAAAEADDKTAKAAKHHADVQAWTLIAEAMAPDGIPGELLSDALRPVNDLLHSLAQRANWARMQLSRDMDITADGRLYGLLSESEQWRADCLLALALANLSGLKLALLDRFDVLDLRGRGELLDLLYDLADAGEVDTVAVFGTLKAAPPSDDLMESYWVQAGEVSMVAPEQERAAA
jgi:hypothetical protein